MEWPPPALTPASTAFPADWIRQCTEVSLKRLGRERIDLLQFHVWRDEWLDADEWKSTIETLKQEGKIQAFGVSVVTGQQGLKMHAGKNQIARL